MTFPAAIRICLTRYVTFAGRASRSEYWYFVLFLFLGTLAAGVIDRALVGADVEETATRTSGPVAGLFALLALLPLLAAGWRRMHDTGRSGLYLFYPLIVIVGILTFMGAMAGFAPVIAGDFGTVIAGAGTAILAVALVVFLVSPLIVLWWLTRPSQGGTNVYGPNPHEVSP